MTIFILWYLIGLVSVMWGASRLDDFTVRDLYPALVIALGGLLTLVYQVSVNTSVMNFVIIKRRVK